MFPIPNMNTLSLYHWDYDHRRPSSDRPFLTFSIAIFQWQPKASGKGLKKVNASRVCGYGADPATVYAKAREVCNRLNAENASVQSRPSWLQTSYSVPQPGWLIVPREERNLPGSTVRSIRIAVMKRLLLPAGFVKGRRGTYVRRIGNQIHLIDFQPDKAGHRYTINLGFHYDFLPPFLAGNRIRLEDYHQLDCIFDARIGQFIGNRHDRWFEYGTSRTQLENAFEENAALCLRILSHHQRKWADPRRWLKASDEASKLQKLASPWRVEQPERKLAAFAEFFSRKQLDFNRRKRLQDEMLPQIQSHGFSASDRLTRDELYERRGG